jgi:hypothetical protein
MEQVGTNPVICITDSLFWGCKSSLSIDIFFLLRSTYWDWSQMMTNSKVEHLFKLEKRQMIIMALGSNNILNIVRKIKMEGRETNIVCEIGKEILIIWVNILLHKIKLK